MSEYITTERVTAGDQEVTVIVLKKRDILEPQTIETCKEEMQQAVDTPSVVLNMEAVENISTAFITILIVLNRSAREAGGRMAICCVQPRVNDVFKLLRIQRIIPVVDTLEEALAALSAEEEL